MPTDHRYIYVKQILYYLVVQEIFFKKNRIPDLIENCEIAQTTNTQFLGVIIYEKLTWSHHITHASLKLSKNIGVLNRLKYSVSNSIFLMLYNTLVLPYLSYCNIIWASTYKTHIKKLSSCKKSLKSDYIV